MKFRPCIDIHAGVVKQIVGSTLRDAAPGETEAPTTNFVATKGSEEFASMYARDNLTGGHIIMLGSGNEEASRRALTAFPGGMQIGGTFLRGMQGIVEGAAAERANPDARGITASNARLYLDAGASHVIVTSYVFRDGQVDWVRLEELVALIGKEKLVLDLSCRKRRKGTATLTEGGPTSNSSSVGTSSSTAAAAAAAVSSSSSTDSGKGEASGSDFEYVVVTDRWQRFTQLVVDETSLTTLAKYCSEFLIHGVDVEGLRAGIEGDLVTLLGKHSPIPVTYAGGVRDMEDLETVKKLGLGRVDVSVGSALDIFGGALPYDEVVEWSRKSQEGSGK